MIDEVFQALSETPRRQILCTLAEHDGPIELDTLGDETIVDAYHWETHQVALYNIHLPELDDQEFIDWDRERQVIEEGAQFDEVRPFVEILNTKSDDENGNGSSLNLGVFL